MNKQALPKFPGRVARRRPRPAATVLPRVNVVSDPTYTYERYRAWRWRRRFAWIPIRTFDAGWVWLRLYWRWQCQWAWGLVDDYPYLYRHSRR
jgi:hypothetical protein